MKKNSGLISVIIPCHNDGRYLTKAVQSVLNQKSPVRRMEILVVNDHSSDPETLDVLSHLEKTAHRVSVLHNTGRPGPAAARNFGVASAKCEWIAFLDADDIWLPGGLNARWQVMESEPQAQWISADFQIVLEDGSLGCESYCKSWCLQPSLILRPAFESGKNLRLRRPVREVVAATGMIAWMGTVIVKKNLFLTAGGFDESLLRSEDTHLWARLALETDLFFVPRTVARWNRREGRLTWPRGTRKSPNCFERDFCWDWEIKAFKMLLRERNLRPYRDLLRSKLTVFSALNIHYHRRHGKVWPALCEAARAFPWASFEPARWRMLLRAVLHKNENASRSA